MPSYLEELYAHQEWADAEHWRALEAHPPALEDKAIRDRLHHIHLVQHENRVCSSPADDIGRTLCAAPGLGCVDKRCFDGNHRRAFRSLLRISVKRFGRLRCTRSGPNPDRESMERNQLGCLENHRCHRHLES